jgi:hypothetical protein
MTVGEHENCRHPAGLGGALGAALESGETVREAAYTYQPDTQIDAVAGPRLRAAGS